jgi:hypothetical protein
MITLIGSVLIAQLLSCRLGVHRGAQLSAQRKVGSKRSTLLNVNRAQVHAIVDGLSKKIPDKRHPDILEIWGVTKQGIVLQWMYAGGRSFDPSLVCLTPLGEYVRAKLSYPGTPFYDAYLHPNGPFHELCWLTGNQISALARISSRETERHSDVESVTLIRRTSQGLEIRFHAAGPKPIPTPIICLTDLGEEQVPRSWLPETTVDSWETSFGDKAK